MRRCNDHGNSNKGEYLVRTGLQVRGLVHCQDSEKHGSAQEHVTREENRSSTSGATGKWKRETHWVWLKHLKPPSLLLATHFLQQDHNYSNKSTPPNSATFYKPMGAIFIIPPHSSLWPYDSVQLQKSP